MQRETYGYAHWDHGQGLICLRNPWIRMDQAEVVLLRVIGGLSVEQVAEIMDRRPGSVRVLQHRALKRLHAELVKAGVTP